MGSLGLLVRLEAKPGREADVEKLLFGGRSLVEEEPDTRTWYAFRMGASMFGIFDTFEDESGRRAHLGGKVAEALTAQADDLFAHPPLIENVDIIASK
jgi:quinol monooxygenase YgiN